MPRINIFLDEDLYNGIQAVKSNLNISKVCQQALSLAIDKPEESEIEKNVHRYLPILTIPAYLIKGLGDQGMIQTISDGVVEDDDLRITIELISGQHILIPSTARLILDVSGDIIIEVPK